MHIDPIPGYGSDRSNAPCEVMNVLEARKEFAPELAQVSAVRRYAVDVACAWALDPVDVGLVADELAANAVVHGRSPFTVTLRRDERHIVIEVADDNPRLPAMLRAPRRWR